MHMSLKFKGYSFKTGDNIIFRLRGSNFIKGKIYIYSNSRFYLCNNEPIFKGTTAPDLLGFQYSWCITLNNNGLILERNDRDLYIFPSVDNLEPKDIMISSKLIEFLYSKYENILSFFYINLDTLSRYNQIKDSGDGFVELCYNKGDKPISVKIKLGRLIRSLNDDYNNLFIDKLNKIELPDATIEKIHNEWKSFNSVISFDIRKGSDIVDIAYNSSKYHSSGYLKSCMTNTGIQLDLYKNNPLQINVVIFYKDNFVCGRALIWKCTDGKWYHDRLYSSFDYVRPSMISILREQGYECLHKVDTKHEVIVDDISCRYYPYLDSMKFIDKENKLLSNKPLSK